MACLVQARTAHAFELGAGFAGVEEGDDRMRPAMGLHVGWNDFYATRVYYYGREFGPVKEETYLATFVRRWGIFKSNSLTAGFGGVVMDEATKITFDAANADLDKDEHNRNLGFAMGLAWSLPPSAAPLYFSVSWDSHVFLAGSGGLLLSTGRKQTISIILGTEIR